MPLNIDWQQILLHLFNFAILFFALYFILYKPVRGFMDKREQMYRDRDKETEQKLADAQKSKDEYEQLLQNASNEIARFKRNEEQSASADAEKIREDAKADAEKILEKARVQAAAERDRIIRSANREIAKTASMMAEKIVTGSGTVAYDRFIESAERSGKDA